MAAVTESQAPPAVTQVSKDALASVKATPPVGGQATPADGAEGTPVFPDATNEDGTHPLASRWTLWFDNPTQQGHLSKSTRNNWGEGLNRVVDVDTVEEFWGLYNNIVPASALPPKANYYLFKDNIKPMWEDPANEKGGKWSFQFSRGDRKHGPNVDRYWLHTMLAAIGETLEIPHPPGDRPVPALNEERTSGEGSLVTGVLLAARPQFYRIAIWTRNALSDDEAEALEGKLGERLMDVGRNFKVHCLDSTFDERLVSNHYGTEVVFQSHDDAEKKARKRKIVL